MRKSIQLLLLIFVFLCSNRILVAQKQVTKLQQVWTGFVNQTRLGNHWGIWAEGQLYTKQDFFSNLYENFVSAGAIYYLNNNTKLIGGYSYVYLYPTDNLIQPEHRPWQQVMWHNNFPRLRLMQWLRLEERFRRKVNDGELADGYNFNYRTRYNFLLMAGLGKIAFAPKTFSFVFNNELFINFGKEIVYNYYDQNRFFVGFAFHTNKQDNLQFGYLNVFQQLSAGNQYRSINAVRVFYFNNLDFRKK